MTTLTSSNLQVNLNTYDTVFGGIVSDLWAQRNAFDTWVDPSYMWASPSAISNLWGQYVVDQKAWAGKTAVYSYLSSSNVTAGTLSTGSSTTNYPHWEGGRYDASEKTFGSITAAGLVSTSLQYLAGAPFTNVASGFYNIRLGVNCRKTMSGTNVATSESIALRYVGGASTNVWWLSSSATNSQISSTASYRYFTEGSVFLGSNSVIYPYVVETVSGLSNDTLQVIGTAFLDVRHTPTLQTTTNIWK
jgi:hypothetical protein